MKKFFSVLLVLAFIISCLTFTSSAAATTDYSVIISSAEQAEAGDTIKVTLDVTNITAREGTGILAASVFLYYDHNILSPVSNSFKGTAPEGWDIFDGTGTPGVWGLYTVFDGDINNTASADKSISFTVSFKIAETAEAQDTYFYVYGCEGTEYNSASLLKIKSFQSTANCEKKFTVLPPQILITKDEKTFIIDRKSNIIYSETLPLDYNSFSSLFSKIGGELSITAFDYEINAENGKYIPNGATISVIHKSGQVFKFTYYLLGDCDCNGIIDLTDLACIKTTIVNRIPVDGYIKFAMEFEKDGAVRIADYLRLKRIIISK